MQRLLKSLTHPRPRGSCHTFFIRPSLARHDWLSPLPVTTQKVIRHALSRFAVHPTSAPPQLCPARQQGPLPGIQAMQPSTDGRWLGRNRRNSPQLVAPTSARWRPHQSASIPFAGATSANDLTRRLIKVIKHDHFPAFLRYNLPPIIRTSPDRASQHRQCPGIGTPAPPTESRPHRSSEAGALAVFFGKTSTYRESVELSLRSVTELFARFACHGFPGGKPSGHGARLGQPFFEVHVFKRA